MLIRLSLWFKGQILKKKKLKKNKTTKTRQIFRMIVDPTVSSRSAAFCPRPVTSGDFTYWFLLSGWQCIDWLERVNPLALKPTRLPPSVDVYTPLITTITDLFTAVHQTSNPSLTPVPLRIFLMNISTFCDMTHSADNVFYWGHLLTKCIYVIKIMPPMLSLCSSFSN